MNQTAKRMFAAGALLAVTLATANQTAQAGHYNSPDVIIDWNQLAQTIIAGPPFSQVRQYAMLQVAVADAVIAVEGGYSPFRVRTRASRGASAQAAAAQAAHDVLLALAPASQATIDAALEASLAGIPHGLRWQGIEVGQKVAAQVLEWRSTDGFAGANAPSGFLASTLPGIWQQTVSGPAQFAFFGNAIPFGLLTTTQFLPAPPPQLESARYAADLNEVKSKGRATSVTRTPEETNLALRWAAAGSFTGGTSLFRIWHNVARDVSQQRGLSLVDTARLYALLAVSIHDSLQTSQNSKFVYRLWRPETAIQQAGIDNNPATDPENPWVPLLTTPAYPSHSSNMQCVGAGAARMLANVFGGDEANFTATWYTAASPPAVAHAEPYTSLWALALDQGESRIMGGIHFRFEIEESQVSCAQVADYIFENYLQPRHGR